jgi:Flp pilus assembly protein TadG
MNRRRQSLRDERGQTMVEFALVVPILCVVLFGIFQFGALYNDYVTVTDATRVGARKAAVSRHEASPQAVAETAARSSASGLTPAKLKIKVTATGWEHGDAVTVEATYPYSINLLGVVVKTGTLKSTTTERVE